MKILITGANGQLGRELNEQLKHISNIELLLTDVSEMDITDIGSVKQTLFKFKPNIVINCAAHTAVDLCEDDIENAYLINETGAKNLSIITKDLGAIIVQLSTDYVFDGTNTKPYIESDETNPKSIYGKSKLAGELAVIQNNPKHFIVRTAWLYGDGKNFVKTMLTLAQTKNTIKVVNDQFGSPTSTKELTKAIMVLMRTKDYGIYHATCEGYCSWYDFAKKIFTIKGIDIVVNPCSSDEFPQKAQRPTYSVMENKNLKDKHSYVFKNWEMALIDFLKEN